MRAKALLKLPYSRILIPDEESASYGAEILEFPGCFAQGSSPDEAYANLESAAEAWLLSYLEQGREVPKPLTNLESSGKFALRLPKSLYARASKAAARDGVSLNQYIVTAVAEHLGAGSVVQAVRDLAERQPYKYAPLHRHQVPPTVFVSYPSYSSELAAEAISSLSQQVCPGLAFIGEANTPNDSKVTGVDRITPDPSN